MSPRTRSRARHFLVSVVLLLIIFALIAHWVRNWGHIDLSGDNFVGPFAFPFLCIAAWIAIASTPPLAVDRWKDGLVGVGTVTNIKHVGLKRGVREYAIALDVESQTGARFQSTLQVPIGRRKLGGIQPGELIPVVFRHAKPQHLEVPQYQMETPAMLMYDYVLQREGLIDQATINANYRGLPAKTRLLSIQPLGARIRNYYSYRLELEIYPPRAAPFRVTKHVYLNDYHHGLVAHAQSLDVKFLPANPQQIVVKIPSDSMS